MIYGFKYILTDKSIKSYIFLDAMWLDAEFDVSLTAFLLSILIFHLKVSIKF